MRTKRVRVAAFLLTLMGIPDIAFAYRPFDGTDAAVAEPGEVEIEFQPGRSIKQQWPKDSGGAGYCSQFRAGQELGAVFEGRVETPLDTPGPTSLTDAGAFLKYVLRPGVLQDQAGPSIATEFGALLPDTIGNSRIGASVAAIISQRWDWGTAHLNIAGALTRDQHPDLFTGIILEGPHKWVVRPVAEFFRGRIRSSTYVLGSHWRDMASERQSLFRRWLSTCHREWRRRQRGPWWADNRVSLRLRGRTAS
jgi:hypothetical protein